MTVGERIRKALKDHQMTQQCLADKLHVCESTVQKWVTQHNGIPADKLVDVSLALEVSILDLLGLNPKDREYEIIETGCLAPSDTLVAWLTNPFRPVYPMDVISSAFRYMVLNYYLEQDEDLTEADRENIRSEQDAILAEYPHQLDDLLEAMQEFDRNGKLFVKDAVKLNKYELAYFYAECDFIAHVSSLSKSEIVRHVNRPFSQKGAELHDKSVGRGIR